MAASSKSMSHDEAVEKLHGSILNHDLAALQAAHSIDILSAIDTTRKLKDTIDEPKLLRCLLEHGADPNAVELQSVVKCNNLDRCLEALQILVDFGFARIPSEGHLVLEDAVDMPAVVDWLLDNGANITQSDSSRHDNGGMPNGTYYYSLHILNRVAAKADIQYFDHLVSRGADPHRSFALHCASECQDTARTTAIIDHVLGKYHLDINAHKDNLRHTPSGLGSWRDSGPPIVSAIINKNLPVVRQLLERGAYFEGPYPPYVFAIGDYSFEGFLPALAPLLEAGADRTVALSRACDEEKPEAVKVCLDYGPDVASLLAEDQKKVEKAMREGLIDPLDIEPEDRPMSVEIRRLLEDAVFATELVQC